MPILTVEFHILSLNSLPWASCLPLNTFPLPSHYWFVFTEIDLSFFPLWKMQKEKKLKEQEGYISIYHNLILLHSTSEYFFGSMWLHYVNYHNYSGGR